MTANVGSTHRLLPGLFQPPESPTSSLACMSSTTSHRSTLGSSLSLGRAHADAALLEENSLRSDNARRLQVVVGSKDHSILENQGYEARNGTSFFEGSEDKDGRESRSESQVATVVVSNSTKRCDPCFCLHSFLDGALRLHYRVSRFSLKPATFAPSTLPIEGNHEYTSESSQDYSESSDSEHEISFQAPHLSIFHQHNTFSDYDSRSAESALDVHNAHRPSLDSLNFSFHRQSSRSSCGGSDLLSTVRALGSDPDSLRTEKVRFSDNFTFSSSESVHVEPPQRIYRKSSVTSPLVASTEDDPGPPTAPPSPTMGESRVILSSSGTSSSNSLERLPCPAPPWANRPSQPELSSASATARKRKRKTLKSQHVITQPLSPSIARRASRSNLENPANHSGSDPLTSAKPVITYRIRTVDPENGEDIVVMKEDYMANFIQNQDDSAEAAIRMEQKEWKKRKWKKPENLMELSLDHAIESRVRFGTHGEESISETSGSHSFGSPDLYECDSEGTLILHAPSATTSRLLKEPVDKAELRKRRRSERTRQKDELRKEKAQALKERKERREQEKAAARAAKAKERQEKIEEREKMKKARQMEGQTIRDTEEMERMQREKEIAELEGLKEKLYAAGVLPRPTGDVLKEPAFTFVESRVVSPPSVQFTPAPFGSPGTLDADSVIAIQKRHSEFDNFIHHEFIQHSKDSTLVQPLVATSESRARTSDDSSNQSAKEATQEAGLAPRRELADRTATTSSTLTFTPSSPAETVRQKFALLSTLGMYSADDTWEFKELGGKIENLNTRNGSSNASSKSKS
ncbi:hypothetical protein C8R42DRAFT_714443 [Lentinula raphanica]|nr:hypothetical protein C8R42DRAFT_714443 [Lentinula raphanica]